MKMNDYDLKIEKALKALQDAYIEKIEYERDCRENEHIICEEDNYKFDSDF